MPDLPNDGRTLLQTPRRPHEQFPIRTVEPGKYCHFGLAAGLQHALCHVEKLPAVLSLTFNIDGLPLSKSSKMQLWPIQCLVGGIDDVAPFLVGAFAGHSKPMSSNDFLVTFVEELQALLSQGVTVNGSLVQVKMRYAIVEFLGLEQVEVVPALWVDDDRCAWPKHIKGDKVTAMVRKAAPPDALWQQFDVSVKGLFATYEQARKKLERSQYTSDLSSDNEMPPGKRVRRPPPQWSESDADPAPARPTKKVQRRVPTVPSDFPQAMVSSVQMQSSSSTGSENAGNLPDHPGSSSDDPCVHGDRQSRASSFEAFDDSNLTDIVTDIGGSQESVSFNEGHQARGREDPQDQEQGFKQHVLRLLNIVRFMVQQHGEMLNKLCEVLPSHAVVVRPRLVEQPFNKLDDLFAFDKTLVNEKAAMLVQEFRELGGKTASKATKSMLAHLLGDQLAAQFSWVGRKGKQNFSSLRTATAIVAAGRQLPGGKDAIEEAIKSWLRHAPERMAGKKENRREVDQADDSE
ncbi:uncharacterized protein LOC115326005 [Ixodes scapularis]|uniref:uncharacterized protein LOC115326005 n=1 Tax=Ixodes scapularis TaxID=6945 RepID=UPI001A9DC761|nr:uncharacterized protein LOC115326005 [Ixodes scapularis]